MTHITHRANVGRLISRMNKRSTAHEKTEARVRVPTLFIMVKRILRSCLRQFAMSKGILIRRIVKSYTR
jgi:hypothetical protein